MAPIGVVWWDAVPVQKVAQVAFTLAAAALLLAI